VTRRLVLRLSVSALEDADELQAMIKTEVDRAVLDVPGLRAVPAPIVRVDAEAPDRLCLSIMCTLEGLMHADAAQRELAKRLRGRLRTARIDARQSALSWGLAWRESVGELRTDNDVSVG
jgi:hypothetical protein